MYASNFSVLELEELFSNICFNINNMRHLEVYFFTSVLKQDSLLVQPPMFIASTHLPSVTSGMYFSKSICLCFGYLTDLGT